MIHKGFHLAHFHNVYGFRSYNYEQFTNFFVKNLRFQDLLDMIRTMRLTHAIFGSILWNMCTYADRDPDTYKYIVSRVIKPLAKEMTLLKMSVPSEVRMRPSEQVIIARAYMDIAVRYFDQDISRFRDCCTTDYQWLCARFFNFTPQVPDTFLALPPTLRKSIRLSLWVTRWFPRDLRNRIARQLAVSYFLGDANISQSLITDTAVETTHLNLSEELKYLLLQKRYADIYRKITGVEPDTSIESISSALGKTLTLGLLTLHKHIADEALLPIQEVLTHQNGLHYISPEDEAYILNCIKRSKYGIKGFVGTVSRLSESFQLRLLYLGVRPSYFSESTFVKWKNAWFFWTPLSPCDTLMYSQVFFQECRTLLLCFKNLHVNVLQQLARLHGQYATFDRGNDPEYHTKYQWVQHARYARVISLEPILTRKQLYPDFEPKVPLKGDEAEPVQKKHKCSSCLDCLLKKWTLKDLKDTVLRWKAYSALLRMK